jgi:hypothetical protein
MKSQNREFQLNQQKEMTAEQFLRKEVKTLMLNNIRDNKV